MGSHPDLNQSEGHIPLALGIGSDWSNQSDVKAGGSELCNKRSLVLEATNQGGSLSQQTQPGLALSLEEL